MQWTFTCVCLNLVEDLCCCPLRQPPTGQDVGGLLTGPEEAQAEQRVPAIRLAIQLIYLSLQVQRKSTSGCRIPFVLQSGKFASSDIAIAYKVLLCSVNSAAALPIRPDQLD